MPGKLRLATVGELEQRKTIRFQYRDEGIPREGFLAWYEGQIRGYENRCKHLPLPLDYGDGQFFTRDGLSFICQTHGAVYEPLTGKCTAGPCAGAELKMLPIAVENGEIYLEISD